MKVELFHVKGCARCFQAAGALRSALVDMGLSYDETVEEKHVREGSSALDDLVRMNLVAVPVIRAGDRVLVQDDAMRVGAIRPFLQQAGLTIPPLSR